MTLLVLFIGLFFLLLINFSLITLTKKMTKIDDTIRLTFLGSLESFIVIMIFSTVSNNYTFLKTLFSCILIETLFLIPNYLYSKYMKINLKSLLIFFATLIVFFITISVIAPLTKKCPNGYKYYKDDKCMKIYETKPKIVSVLKCDGHAESEIQCVNNDYGYSKADNTCYKIDIKKVLK